jgi:hypothetical protein
MAMVEDGGEGGDGGTDYRVDVPIPATCDAKDAKVKFSKKRFTLTVRFTQATSDREEETEEAAEGDTEEIRGVSMGSTMDARLEQEQEREDDDEDEDEDEDEEEEEEDNPLAEYLRMLGMKRAFKGAATAKEADEEEGGEQQRVRQHTQEGASAAVEEKEREDERVWAETEKEKSVNADGGEGEHAPIARECPLCPSTDAANSPSPIEREHASNGNSDSSNDESKDTNTNTNTNTNKGGSPAAAAAAAAAATRPISAVLTAGLVAAATPLMGSNANGVVVANSTSVRHTATATASTGRGGSAGGTGGNKKRNKKKKRNQGVPGNSSQSSEP